MMPNHIHLIVVIRSGTMWASSPTQSVSQLIRSFKTLVTKELGEQIWQRSYYDHIIRDEADYLRIAEYIQNNPARWREDRFYIP
ncbi:MAG: transposase [Clostridia bacterium]|nr:transposase [Clostridia bacterium]